MSPMLVYFLMMADDIKEALSALAFVLGAVSVALWFVRTVVYELDGDNTPQAITSASKKAPWIFAITLAFSTFMPGTKTIAAMVVLPKITSPQALDAMGNEAKELYGLAKDALRNLAGDEKPAKSDK